MSADVRAALSERGIELRRYGLGEHRAPCPWCDRGPRDDALAVKIDRAGATWICHRCSEKGGTHQTQGGDRSGPRPQPPRAEPERHEVLSAGGRNLWSARKPIEPDTVAGHYLAKRGCRLPPRSGDLRWHPEQPYHVPGQRKPIYVGPALVGLVTDILTCEPISLHRTWLREDGSGKADLGEHKVRKLLWKHRSDGVIRLWPDDEITKGLVLGEGIETCLAAARAGLGPVWSTISVSNLAAFPVLPGIEGLTILVDHDKPNRKTGKGAGHEAALELTARYVAAGFDPERDIMWIEPDGETLDVADLVAGCGR